MAAWLRKDQNYRRIPAGSPPPRCGRPAIARSRRLWVADSVAMSISRRSWGVGPSYDAARHLSLSRQRLWPRWPTGTVAASSARRQAPTLACGSSDNRRDGSTCICASEWTRMRSGRICSPSACNPCADCRVWQFGLSPLRLASAHDSGEQCGTNQRVFDTDLTITPPRRGPEDIRRRL